MNPDITISVVIPVLADREALAALLDRLSSSADRAEEIIVVDGATDQPCRALSANRGCAYLATRAGRGRQLDAGARRATGDVIWFLHADAEPPDSAIGDIKRAIGAGATGGFFRFRFAGRRTWYKEWLGRLINFRARFGTPYGDQGLFFLRSVYAEIGGFPDAPLFEEIPLVKAARRKGHFIQLNTSIGVSPRRWERDGWLRRTLANRMLALGYAAGISPETLARRYHRNQTSASH